MKKILFFTAIMLCFMTVSYSQNKVKGTLYKADSWANIKDKGFANAMDNLTKEKVEVLLTDKYIKVTFGTKVSKYIIVSKNKFSAVKMDYNVTLNNKSYILSIATIDGSIAINIDGQWMIPEVKSTSSVDVTE